MPWLSVGKSSSKWAGPPCGKQRSNEWSRRTRKQLETNYRITEYVGKEKEKGSGTGRADNDTTAKQHRVITKEG
jgi:hypothetical protein